MDEVTLHGRTYEPTLHLRDKEPRVGSVGWGNGSNSPQLVRGNGSNSLHPTISGVSRDSRNTGTIVCSTHATGMRPGILTPRAPYDHRNADRPTAGS
jgi:hypothetical protein